MSASEHPPENLAVTKNVGMVVRQLRHPNRPRVLWVDQICIDQADRDERAQQVLIMGDIYRVASQCIVWLGREYDGSNDAMSLVEDLGRIFPKLSIQELVAERLHEFNLPSEESPLWTNLYLLFQTPWFQRMWTAQEIIVSQTATFMCGSKIVTLATMMQFTFGLESQSQIMHNLFTPAAARYGPDVGLVQLTVIGYFRFEVRNRDANTRVLHTLESFSIRRNATDPRDKIFGILGVLSPEQKRQLVTVDYTRSVEDVYIDVATSLIEHFEEFYMLYLAGTENQKLQNPSWVPDWTVSIRKKSYAGAWRIRESERCTDLSRGHRSLYQAAAYNSTTAQIDKSAKTLRLSCTLVDRAKYIGHTFSEGCTMVQVKDTNSSVWLSGGPQWCEDLGSCFGLARVHARNRYRNLDEIQRACNFCLVAGKFGKLHERADPVILTRCWASQFRIAEYMVALDRASWTSENLDIVYETGSNTSKFSDFQQALESALCGHTFFVSSSGYIGLGPSSIKSGDEICIIHGLPVPFIVRRISGNSFSLVGECYIQDIMDGELFRGGRIIPATQDIVLM